MSAPASERYARYVLGVLVLVYVFNFLDRQILSILAERIKPRPAVSRRRARVPLRHRVRRLLRRVRHPARAPRRRLGPAQADRARARGLERDDRALGVRPELPGAGGRAHRRRHRRGERRAGGLSRCSRTGFPPARRATALAIYSSGIYIGAGLGLAVGGVDRRALGRRVRRRRGAVRPARLAGRVPRRRAARASCWRSGCATLREPTRGQSEGARRRRRIRIRSARCARGAGRRAAAAHAARRSARAGRRAPLATNLALAAAVAVGVGAAHRARSARRRSGSRSASASTPRSRGCSRSRAATGRRSTLLSRTPALRSPASASPCWRSSATASASGCRRSSSACTASTRRTRRVRARAGTAAAAGWLGTTLGGVWADARRGARAAGRLHVGVACGLLAAPLAVWHAADRATRPSRWR